MANLALSAFLALASQCAPSIAPDTLAAVAKAESSFNETAINLNGVGGGTLRPPTRADAVALATNLIVNQRRSVDLGLMQVNSANLSRLGLTIADAFDPCINVAAGARILREGYAAAVQADPGQPQRALRVAFSRYNTGHPERGFANGYVRRVEAAAAVVVPAIRIAEPGARAPAASEDTATPMPRRPPPGLQDALRATPAIPDPEDGMADAFHRPAPKEPTP